jgi:hypothetical protein
MTLEFFVSTLNSLRDWPSIIGIIGGEPLLHPEFRAINAVLRKHFPPKKLGLWTSGIPRTMLEDPRNDLDIKRTYGFVAYNPHDMEQIKKCRHQPLTISISEVVTDESIRLQLVDNCWVQRTWCPTITHKGAYFCEVAAAQDILLNEGAHAWPLIEEGSGREWWRRQPDEFDTQKNALCFRCGMPIPMERELLLNQKEKFSPKLLNTFRERGLKRTSAKDVEIYDHIFNKEELQKNILTWFPGNYREDLKSDESAIEGRGFPGELC